MISWIDTYPADLLAFVVSTSALVLTAETDPATALVDASGRAVERCARVLESAFTKKSIARGDQGLRLLGTVTMTLLATAAGAFAESRSIGFVHTHTGESIVVEFKRDGTFDRRGVKRLNRFLRDHRNGETRDMDPKLFDILYEIRERAGTHGPFHLISAYRSPETNAMLRRTSSGVARKSLHTHGRAIDVRLPGVDTEVLRDIALALEEGGVGYYAGSDFIHVDTGRVRRWAE